MDGARIFYREAGAPDAPVVLLPHGYPCSSYQFRNLLPALADRWRLIAPDFPGSGYSDTPADFEYSFDGYAGSWIGSPISSVSNVSRSTSTTSDRRSACASRSRGPRIAALIIQNGDIYEDQLGPKYAGLQEYFRNPTAEGRAKLAEAISEEGYREEFLNDVTPRLAERIPPDLWKLHWSLTTPQRREIYLGLIAGLRENLAWFPRYQAYLREHRPPTLIVWGPQDGYMPEGAARAYLRDLPDAELHLLDGGHWLLETHLLEVSALMRDFLERNARGVTGVSQTAPRFRDAESYR